MTLSVVLCSYNGEKYIAEQLNSIIRQTHAVNEIIVCGDGSKDNTVAIAESILKDCNIDHTIIKRSSNYGVSRNFLEGMKLAAGDYIFSSDQDDIWQETKVECFYRHALATHKELYFSNGVLVSDDGITEIGKLWDVTEFYYERKLPMLDVLLNHTVVTGAAMMVSKSLVDKIDTIPEAHLHDSWFAAIAAMDDSIEPINEETFYYRQHSANVIGAHKRTILEKIRSWSAPIMDIELLKHQREQKYRHYLAMLPYANENNSKVSDCVNFWTDINKLREESLLKRLDTVLRHQRKGDYCRYKQGIRHFVQDIITAAFL